MRHYRRLLRLYPRAVRERDGAEMEWTYARRVALESARGRWRGLRARAEGMWDVVRGAVAAWRAEARLAQEAGGKRSSRERMGDWMRSVVADFRYAVRSLWKQPQLAVAASVTMALGIGANTSIFSVVYGLAMRPLPYPEPDRLVMVWSTNPGRGWTRTDVPLSDAVEWQSRSGVFEELLLMGRASPNLTGLDRPERLEARLTTPNVLSVFGAKLAVGRAFEPGDAVPGGPATAVLMHGFWQRRFGGDPGVVGRTLMLDGAAVTVIGVTEPAFEFPDTQPDVLLPFRVDLSATPRTNHSHLAIGRLAKGVTLDRARREVAAAAAALEEEYPETNRGWSANVVSLQSDILGPTGRQASVVLMAAVSFVLLMACVNVANLLLARGSARRREMAVRGALGAGRARLIRQLLTESLVLALAGGALGLLVSFLGVHAIAAGMPSEVPDVVRIALDGPAVAFTLAAALVSTLVFGTVPALRSSDASIEDLKDGGRGGMPGRGARRFGGTLVVIQVALAVVLLVGGGVMMRSVVSMHRYDMGYDPEDVLTLRMTPPSSRYESPEQLDMFWEAVLERVRALPGVEAAGTIQSPPLAGSNSVNTFEVVGQEGATPAGGYPARMGYLSPGYLDAMRISILRGRGIEPADRAGAARIALVNRTLALARFGDRDPIGSALRVDGEEWTVVGVVADMRERSLTREPEPSIYLPVAQDPVRTRTLAIRGGSDVAVLATAVQRQVASIDPDQPVFAIETMEGLMSRRMASFRLMAGLMLSFAIISLLLGAVGIYGVTAYGVGRRRSEIGIRIAIGAGRGEVVRMIVREGLRRSLIGLALGVPAAFGLSRALRGLLVGVSPSDPVTFGAVILLLLTVAGAGAYLPARRAAKLDPVRSLGAGG